MHNRLDKQMQNTEESKTTFQQSVQSVFDSHSALSASFCNTAFITPDIDATEQQLLEKKTSILAALGQPIS